MLNKVMLIGRLGKDPELRYTNNDQAVASFSIATDESYTDNDGERQKKTEWHNIVVWGKLAETVEKYLHKGSLAYFEGKIQTRKWEDKEGNDRYTTEVVAFTVRFLEPKGDDNQDDRHEHRGSSRDRGDRNDRDNRGSRNNKGKEVKDEDIPF